MSNITIAGIDCCWHRSCAMRTALLALLLLPVPVQAYDGTTKGAIEMARDAALGRQDQEAACRHAINLGSLLNSQNKLTAAEMRKIGQVCAAVR